MSVRTKCSPSVNPKCGSKRDREDGKGDELKHNEETKKRVRIGGHPPQPDETEPETGEESEEDESPDTSDEDDDSELTSESSLIGSLRVEMKMKMKTTNTIPQKMKMIQMMVMTGHQVFLQL